MRTGCEFRRDECLLKGVAVMRRVIWGLLVLGSSAEADTIKFRATFACTDFQMTQYMLVENVREDPWLREFLLQKLGAGECRLFSAGEDVVVYERRGNLVCIGNTGSADKCWWTNARGVVRPTVDRERQGNPAGHGPEAGEAPGPRRGGRGCRGGAYKAPPLPRRGRAGGDGACGPARLSAAAAGLVQVTCGPSWTAIGRTSPSRRAASASLRKISSRERSPENFRLRISCDFGIKRA
jgi:hypothetical protein